MSGKPTKEEIHHGLDLRALDVKDAVREVKQSKRRERPDDTEHGGDSQNSAHVPDFGLVPVDDVVVCDPQDGGVVEQRQHDDHDCRQWIEIEDDDRQRHEQKNTQRLGDAIDRVTLIR